MRFTVLCALGFLGQTLFAEDAGKSIVNDLVKHWQASKKLALAVAGAMPGNAYSFKAPNAEFEFAGQLGNIALTEVLACSLALGTPAPGPFQSALDRRMDSTKSGVTKSLTAAYDYCIDGLQLMNDAELFQMAAFAGHPASKFDIFWAGYAHATYGLGKAESYLRLQGMVAPDTGPRYEF